MLMNSGKNQILNLVAGKNTDTIIEIHIGTGSTAAVATQTALISESLSVIASTAVDTTNKTLTFTGVFEADGGTYREIGIFTSADIMIFRQVIGATAYAAGDSFIVSVVVSYS